jgi:hypothetical protein
MARAYSMRQSSTKEYLMELIRRHLASQPSGYAAYLSLQRALMRHHIAKGGTAEDFCRRLSPIFRARYGAVLDAGARRSYPVGIHTSHMRMAAFEEVRHAA